MDIYIYCYIFYYVFMLLFSSEISIILFLQVLFLELAHSVGLNLLIFRFLPHVDMMLGHILMTSVYVIPALLNMVTGAKGLPKPILHRITITCVAALAFMSQLLSLSVITYQVIVR